MAEHGPACVHLHVEHAPIAVGAGALVDDWVCRLCGTHFTPRPTKAAAPEPPDARGISIVEKAAEYFALQDVHGLAPGLRLAVELMESGAVKDWLDVGDYLEKRQAAQAAPAAQVKCPDCGWTTREPQDPREHEMDCPTAGVKFSAFTDYGDLLTAEEWAERVRNGDMNADDGSGCWAMGKKFSRDHGAFGPRPPWATHVAWFNK
jgi:hypothetical protein